MRIVAVSNLFPNIHNPQLGMFNVQEFRALSRIAEIKVISPVPCGRARRMPKRGVVEGMDVIYPSHLVTPKIGRTLYWRWLVRPLFRAVRLLISEGFDPDIFLAVWCDPDGIATLNVAHRLRKPCIIKAVGTDINLLTQSRLRRRSIRKALNRADKVISVSNDLKRKIVEIGVDEDKIEVHYNGIDTRLFRPIPRSECVARLIEDGVSPEILNRRFVLYVGNFYPIKGVRYLIEAFDLISKAQSGIDLVLVGDGIERKSLASMAEELGIGDRVHFVGRYPHDRIPLWMNAAEMLCLPSLNEGLPNVILEAHACGIPVVASDVGGVREILRNGEGGFLCAPADPNSIARAILMSRRPWKAEKIRALVEGFSWDQNARRIIEIGESLVNL